MSNLPSKLFAALLAVLPVAFLPVYSQVDLDFSDHLPKGVTTVSNVHTFGNGTVQFQMGNTIFNMDRTGQLVTAPYQSEVTFDDSAPRDKVSGDLLDNKKYTVGVVSDSRFTARPDSFIVERLYSDRPNEVKKYALPIVTNQRWTNVYESSPGKTVDFVNNETAVITELVTGGDCEETKKLRSGKAPAEVSYIRILTVNLESGETTQVFAFLDSAAIVSKYPARKPVITRNVQFAGIQGDMKLIWVINCSHTTRNEPKSGNLYDVNSKGTLTCYGLNVFTGETVKLDEVTYGTADNTASCRMSFHDGTLILQELTEVAEKTYQSKLMIYEVVNGKIKASEYPFPTEITAVSPSLSEIKMARSGDDAVPYFLGTSKGGLKGSRSNDLIIFLDHKGTVISEFNKVDRFDYSEYIVNYKGTNTYIDMVPGGSKLVDGLDALLCRKYPIPFNYSFYVDNDTLKTFSICVDNRPAPGMSTKAIVKFREFPLVVQ